MKPVVSDQQERLGQVNSWRLREHQPGEAQGQTSWSEERRPWRGLQQLDTSISRVWSSSQSPGFLSLLGSLKQEPHWPGIWFFPKHTVLPQMKCQHGGRGPSSIEHSADAEPLLQDADRAGGRGEAQLCAGLLCTLGRRLPHNSLSSRHGMPGRWPPSLSEEEVLTQGSASKAQHLLPPPCCLPRQ